MADERRFFFRDALIKSADYVEKSPLPGLTSHAMRFFKSQLGSLSAPESRSPVESRTSKVLRSYEPMTVTGTPFGGRVIAAGAVIAPSVEPLSRAWAVFAHRDGALSSIELVLDRQRGWTQNVISSQNRFWAPDQKTVVDGGVREGEFRYQAEGAPIGEVREIFTTPWGSIVCISDQFIEVFPDTGLIVRRVALGTSYPRQVNLVAAKEQCVRLTWLNAHGFEFSFTSHSRPSRDALVFGDLSVTGAEALPDYMNNDPKTWLRARLLPVGQQGMFAAPAEHTVPFAIGQNYRASLVVAPVGDGAGIGDADGSIVSVREDWF